MRVCGNVAPKLTVARRVQQRTTEYNSKLTHVCSVSEIVVLEMGCCSSCSITRPWFHLCESTSPSRKPSAAPKKKNRPAQGSARQAQEEHRETLVRSLVLTPKKRSGNCRFQSRRHQLCLTEKCGRKRCCWQPVPGWVQPRTQPRAQRSEQQAHALKARAAAGGTGAGAQFDLVSTPSLFLLTMVRRSKSCSDFARWDNRL